jgi:FAD/FMN-containing dehydrogenase
MPDDLSNVGAGLPVLRGALSTIVGEAHVRADAASLALHSADIWDQGSATAALIVAPDGVDQLSRSLAAITHAGFSVAPRGAGMSYTGGYVPQAAHTVSVDTSRMDRILAIRPDDMVVTVQAGCTWAALHEALASQGLRTPFWGPMSGLKSTVGGGLSQLNAMFGAGHYGTSSQSVVALTVVLADGRVLRTGAGGADGHTPFYRHYGPDLAGLFCGDGGVFGIKAEVTLRLMRAPAHEGYASFSFPTGEALLGALADVARAGIACESCGFDPGLTRIRMARASLAGDAQTLGAVMARQKSWWAGLVAGLRVVRGGRSFIPEGGYPLHLVFEGRAEAAVQADVAAARRIAAAAGGQEIENTIAKVIRAVPFPPLNSVLGPAGQRWAPIHGIAPLSKAAALFSAIEAIFADMAADFTREGVSTAYLFTHLETNAIIVEPVFYWPESRFAVHEAAMEPAHLARLPVLPANPAATALVREARRRVIDAFAHCGCAHFQIGRTYPYAKSRDAASWGLVEAAKAYLDPAFTLNPGVLGVDLSKGV